jgi:hypothetical protein
LGRPLPHMNDCEMDHTPTESALQAPSHYRAVLSVAGAWDLVRSHSCRLVEFPASQSRRSKIFERTRRHAACGLWRFCAVPTCGAMVSAVPYCSNFARISLVNFIASPTRGHIADMNDDFSRITRRGTRIRCSGSKRGDACDYNSIRRFCNNAVLDAELFIVGVACVSTCFRPAFAGSRHSPGSKVSD